MRRVFFALLFASLLAACSSTPQRTALSAGGAASTRSHKNAWRTPTVPNGWPEGLPRFVDHSVGQEEISIQAMGLVGVPYRWGGNTVAGGFDCSGLVQYIVSRAANVDLPRTTEEMGHVGQAIEPDEVAPGDLLFFNTTGRAHSHVGIYVGANRFVNAPSTGGTVRIDYINNVYWAKHFDGIRRVAPPRDVPAPLPIEQQPVYAQSPPRPSDAAAAVAAETPHRGQLVAVYGTQMASVRRPVIEPTMAAATGSPGSPALPYSSSSTDAGRPSRLGPASANAPADPLMSLLDHSDGAEATPLNATAITAASPRSTLATSISAGSDSVAPTSASSASPVSTAPASTPRISASPVEHVARRPLSTAAGQGVSGVSGGVPASAVTQTAEPSPASIAGAAQDPIAQFAHDSF